MNVINQAGPVTVTGHKSMFYSFILEFIMPSYYSFNFVNTCKNSAKSCFCFGSYYCFQAFHVKKTTRVVSNVN